MPGPVEETTKIFFHRTGSLDKLWSMRGASQDLAGSRFLKDLYEDRSLDVAP
ncbi:MAG: hypothetical protein OJF47_001794 [Nitrospira sp.]|nr:MAG: hypothetical protein OJF47_001794 [Nitrospira sp.]